jgi:3'-phosphoadenosine 5'-phosphosulfate sulfotransferase (PAPS reductase)/FAD synthetase
MLQLPSDTETWPAERVVAYALEQFPGRVALACSFQKEETVLLDLLFAADPKARVFAIDTHHLFPETYELWKEIEARYDTTIEVFSGDPVEDGLWERNPDLYLAKAKLEPLNRALLDLDCWITGIRRDQSPVRADAPKLGWDEQHELWKAIEARYDTTIETFAGEPVEDGLWERNPDLYLAKAKIEPLNRALLDLDCWITGIRRDQSPTRADAPKLGWDSQHELWKANPIADWTDDDCWAYIRERGLPYNSLHDQGYDSIGDTHSTAPGKGREGRWAGTERTECGLHT